MHSATCYSCFLFVLLMVVNFTYSEETQSICADSENIEEDGEYENIDRLNDPESIVIRFIIGPSLCDFKESWVSGWKRLVSCQEYDDQRPTILYIHGYTEHPRSSSIKTVATAYLEANASNFFLLDWSNMARPPYSSNALPNTAKVAKRVAEELSQLLKSNDEFLTKLHVVGHSLGGQIAGMSGKRMKEYGIHLPRITALDPALPGFYPDYIFETERIEAEDAIFVDIIHTDSWRYGMGGHVGKADFWPNGGSQQPGCEEDLRPSTEQSYCSHHRSWRFWAESIYYPKAFKAVKEFSYSYFQDSRNGNYNNNGDCIYMGPDVDMSAVGDFFFITNGKSPFGRGEDGIIYNP